MYIEYKGNGLYGDARIGRVTFSKTGKSLYYQGRRFDRDSKGYKYNYRDAETNERYWISGCHRDGGDALYANKVEIDEDIREEYWLEIREMPESKEIKSFKCVGKYAH